MDMKRIAAALAAAGVGVAGAQMGPGMMHGGGAGMGHRMGPATAGGPADCPMGGPGAGYGMRGGMMGGGMMGGGMMGGHMMGGHMKGGPEFPALGALDLDKSQRDKVRDIQRDSQRKMHALMGTVHELRWQDEDAARPGEFDAAAARKRYDAHASVQKQMFEARLDAHKRILEVLTKEQRDKLGK